MAEGMRLLVCGGRGYVDVAAAFFALDAVHAQRGVSVVIAGGARGADSLAASWARQRGIELREFSADWNANGRGAGPTRNQQMLDEGAPDGVVAFPGGRGTADMKRRAIDAGLKVWEPYGP